MSSVCVFCGSRAGRDPNHVALAAQLGYALARAGCRIVYGGASVGLMGVVADEALSAGGAVLGVLVRSLKDRELAHPGLTELRIVERLSERKSVMVAESDGFVVLPGGIGTLDELFEVWTMTHLAGEPRWISLLDPSGYYEPLLTFLDRAVEHGFLDADVRARLEVARTIDELLARIPNPT